jgi:hypothetical protein
MEPGTMRQKWAFYGQSLVQSEKEQTLYVRRVKQSKQTEYFKAFPKPSAV